jgi:hypothetical protein
MLRGLARLAWRFRLSAKVTDKIMEAIRRELVRLDKGDNR